MNKQEYQRISREYREGTLSPQHLLFQHFEDMADAFYADSELPTDAVPQALYRPVSEAYEDHICDLLRWHHWQELENRLDRLDAWGWA